MTPDTTATEADADAEADAVIIGAGPVGLFAVFELGLLEIEAHVIDALPQVGGQPGELYPDKPIYDIPGIPVCSGQALIDGLMRQIAPFKPRMHLGHQVSTLLKQGDGRFLVETHKGLRLLAKTVFIAAGVGAFVPKRLATHGIDAFEDRQLFYSVADAARFAGQRLVVVGGGDSAVDWAIHFATQADDAPASVTLLHRRDSFQAAPASVARMRELCQAGAMRFVVGQVDDFEQQDGRLAAIQVLGPDGQTQPLPLDALLVFHRRQRERRQWLADQCRRQLGRIEKQAAIKEHRYHQKNHQRQQHQQSFHIRLLAPPYPAPRAHGSLP